MGRSYRCFLIRSGEVDCHMHCGRNLCQTCRFREEINAGRSEEGSGGEKGSDDGEGKDEEVKPTREKETGRRR